MNIGRAAAESGLPVRTIRYYEDIGLVVPGRCDNGYRDFASNDLHRLRFLQRARNLGFSLDECRALLSLYDDTGRASADVKRLAEARVAVIDRKLAELHSLRRTLADLAEACRGDSRPDCPIIDELAGTDGQ